MQFRNETQASFVFDNGVLQDALKHIYEQKFRPMTDIEENLFGETLRIFNQATDKGFGIPEPTDPDYGFVHEIKHNNAIFSAFKVHRMQNDMAALLLDSNGNLKPFEEWVKEVMPIADHQVINWLRTEYDTMVIRAHHAADWRRFQRYKDILPNLRWMPTTSTQQDGVHRVFWEMRLTLPVDHWFWKRHKPGDRWNCKCGLEATADDATPDNLIPGNPEQDTPVPGLDNNPGEDAKLFSDSHPYIKNSHKGARKAVENFIDKLGYKQDKEYGERLFIHEDADKTELEDNRETARILLDNFKKMNIRIREHVLIQGRKNPEYLIDGLIGDAKRIQGYKGITAGFSKAIEQGCTVVIIDLNKHLADKKLNIGETAKRIDWRRMDFENGAVERCYVIYLDKSVLITGTHNTRDKIKTELKKLEP